MQQGRSLQQAQAQLRCEGGRMQSTPHVQRRRAASNHLTADDASSLADPIDRHCY